MIWTDSDIKRLATAVCDELEKRGQRQDTAEMFRQIRQYVSENEADRSSPYEAGLSVPEFLSKVKVQEKTVEPECRTHFCSCPGICGLPRRWDCLRETDKICLSEYVDNSRYSVWRGKVSI